MTTPCPILPALLARVAEGPIPFGELAMDWLPDLDAAGVTWRITWIDRQGVECETGQGRLALVYEEKHE